jgi:predicted nucleotidyltransferase
MSAHIELDPEFVAEFCKRNRICKLALFGSVLTDRFRPESDLDVLVEFEDGARVGLFESPEWRSS